MARPIPTAPSAPSSSPPKVPAGTSSASTTTSGTSGGSSSGGGSGGGSGSGGDPYGYRAAAAKRYERQAQNLQVQANALTRALKKDFKKSLRQKLENINERLATDSDLVTDGYADRVRSLSGIKKDNDKASEGQTNAARGNMLRERNSAVTEAMSMGAGESDLLAAQQMSLRNWNANQNEVNRSMFDTVRSINASLIDANVDTKTGLTNLYSQANADKDLAFTNYYNRRSEALTQLGNIYGQQADLYASAQEYGGKRSGEGARKEAAKAFDQAANVSGKAFDDPGVPKWVKKWDGRDEFNTGNNLSRLDSVQSVSLSKKPEGATLREWEA